MYWVDAAELSKLLRSVVARYSLEARYAAIRNMDESGEMQAVGEVEAEKDTTTSPAPAPDDKTPEADLTKAIFYAKDIAESDLNSKVAALLLRLAKNDNLFGCKESNPPSRAQQKHANRLSKSITPCPLKPRSSMSYAVSLPPHPLIR